MMQTTIDPSRRWWQSRRLWLFLLVGVLVLLVVRIGFDLWAGRRVRAEVARLEAKYGSLTLSAGWPPEVPDADNRARLVAAAAALVMPGDSDRAMRRFAALPDRSSVPDELRAFVDANRESLRLVDQARQLGQASWDLDRESTDDQPPLYELRTLSNAAYLAALLDIEAGRPDEAVQTLEGGLVVAASLDREPMLIAQLIRIAVALRQFEGVEELIARAEPSALVLEALARRLQESHEPDPLAISLVGELRYGNEMLSRMDDGRAGQPGSGGQPSLRIQMLRLLGRPVMRLSQVRYLEEMEALIELHAGPRPREAFESRTGTGWLDRWVPTAGIVRAIDTGDQFVAALGVAELGVALRRHRLAHGTYPEDIAAVTPAYLPSLPIDPFTGQPPVYARQGEGFTLRAWANDVDRERIPALEWIVRR